MSNFSLSNQSNISFPSLRVKESEKDEDYHKRYVLAIANQTIDSNYDLDYAAIEQCQQFYSGVQSGEEYAFLQEAEDGEALPAKWINFNKIRTKVNLLLGELIRKSYRISVKTINKDAKERKLEERLKSKADLKLRPHFEEIEQISGIPLQNGGLDLENEQEVDDYYEYDYEEVPELIMKHAVNYCTKRSRWDYKRVALFRDILIAGRAFVKLEIINGIPRVERIDPKFVVWDREATDDFLTDATYFGIIRYMNIGDVQDKYNLTDDEVESIKSSHNQRSKYHRSFDQKNLQTNLDNLISDGGIKFTKEEGGELRVLVIEGYWSDAKKINNKVSEDKYGQVHYKTVHPDNDGGKNIISKSCKIWRRATLLGGEITKDWGEIKNMPRSVDDPSYTGCPIKGLVPHYVNKNISSVTSQLKGLQDLKNITMYNIQLAMSRAGSKGFIYDVSQTPDDWDVHTVIRYLKTAGIAFINSKQDGLPSTFNQFQTFDLTLSQSVEQYINISMMIDREMDAISGINEARQGIVQNSSQAVGVTQSALLQSNLTTETYFNFFRMYSSEIYDYLAGLVKIAWRDKDRFAPIIGESGINFLSEDIDLSMDDFGISLEEVPPAINDIQNLHEIVKLALQSQQIDLVDAMKILRETDIDYAIKILERSLNKKQQEMMQQQQQAIQQQQAMQQQQLQAQQQEKQQEMAIKQQESQTDRAADIDKIREKGKFDLANTAIKSRVDLKKINLDFKNKGKENSKKKVKSSSEL